VVQAVAVPARAQQDAGWNRQQLANQLRSLLREHFPAAIKALKATGPRTHYDHRREVGDRHSSALRNTFNRMLGCLFHCLQTGQLYDETAAFGARLDSVA
jgi:hypothetical protein